MVIRLLLQGLRSKLQPIAWIWMQNSSSALTARSLLLRDSKHRHSSQSRHGLVLFPPCLKYKIIRSLKQARGPTHVSTMTWKLAWSKPGPRSVKKSGPIRVKCRDLAFPLVQITFLLNTQGRRGNGGQLAFDPPLFKLLGHCCSPSGRYT